MKKGKWKKATIVTSLVVCGALAGSALTAASNGILSIKAAMNYNINFKVNGTEWVPTDNSGAKQYAIVYNGTTYLPLKATADALGATAKWDSKSQIININKSGSSSNSDDVSSQDNFGVPYQDADDSTSSYSKSKSSNSSSSNVSAPAGVIRLSGNTASMNEKLRAEALKVVKMYGQALANRDENGLDEYLNAYVSPKIEDTPTMDGREKSKEDFEKYYKWAMGSSMDIKKYSNTLKNVKLSDIEDSYISVKDEYGQSFQYKFYPDDIHNYKAVYVYFEFTPDEYGSDNYILSHVYLN